MSKNIPCNSKLLYWPIIVISIVGMLPLRADIAPPVRPEKEDSKYMDPKVGILVTQNTPESATVILTYKGLNPNKRRDSIIARKAVKKTVQQLKRKDKLVVFLTGDYRISSALANFLIKKASKTLVKSDYKSLSSIWSKTLICYHLNRGKEKFLYPSRHPLNWW